MGKPAADTRRVHDRPGEQLIVPAWPRVSRWRSGGAGGDHGTAACPPGGCGAPAFRCPGHRRRVDGGHGGPCGRAPRDAVRHDTGSFRSCVIQRESSGNPRAVNPSSGAGGRMASCRPPGTASGFLGCQRMRPWPSRTTPSPRSTPSQAPALGPRTTAAEHQPEDRSWVGRIGGYHWLLAAEPPARAGVSTRAGPGEEDKGLRVRFWSVKRILRGARDRAGRPQ